MKLSADAYNGLNKIAEKTRMDCWFWIKEGTEEDYVYDLEYDRYMPMEMALQDFQEGITEPLSAYGLTSSEEQAVQALFDTVNTMNI